MSGNKFVLAEGTPVAKIVENLDYALSCIPVEYRYHPVVEKLVKVILSTEIVTND